MRVFIFILCFSTQLLLNAQGWRTRPFVQPYTDFSRCIFETTPNNYIGIGDRIEASGKVIMCVMGFNAQGQLLWTKEYFDSTLSYGESLFESHYGYKQDNYIYYTRFGYDLHDTSGVGILFKFDFNGDTVFQKTYRDTSWHVVPQQVTSSVDGGLLFTGLYVSPTKSNMPCLIIKTDSNGNELWRKEIHRQTNDPIADVIDGRAIIQDSTSKKIIAVGYQNNNVYATRGSILILDSLGNKLEQRDYMENIGGIWTDIVQTPDKKFVAVGKKYYKIDANDPIGKGYAIKFDINSPASANPIWTYETGNNGGFNSMQLLPDGNLILASNERITDTLGEDGHIYHLHGLTKLNDSGQELWQRYYDYRPDTNSLVNFQAYRNLSLTSDNGFVAAVELAVPQPAPFLFVKYDENGCDSTLVYCEAKYNTGVEKLKIENEKLKIYPNPTSNLVTVELPQSNVYDLKMTNVLGAICKEISFAKEKTEMDLSELKSGIYFLQVYEKEKLLATQKVIKQ